MRKYEETHPWIAFNADLSKLSARAWMLLGEAQAQCEHIAGVPLRPPVAARLHQIYLSKGIHGTASIEGNTLSEDEVLARVQGELPLPPSREYLGREIDNILRACNDIIAQVVEGKPLELTPERVAHFNRQVLDGLEVEEGVVPGKVRTHDVGVLRYKGAPPEDCEYLLERMCKWLNGLTIEDGELSFSVAIIKAIFAHLYIAWIHPFGDGNGRTARLIEFQLLVQSGVPIPAAHLLSDFYNKTRDAYYRELDRTSKQRPYRPEVFAEYALRGFVDELREQIDVIREEQMQVTFENYVHELFRDEADTPALGRRKRLVLDLPADGRAVPRSKIPELSPKLAAAYAGKTSKTLTRDLNELSQKMLITRGRTGIRVNRRMIRAFLPVRAEQ